MTRRSRRPRGRSSSHPRTLRVWEALVLAAIVAAAVGLPLYRVGVERGAARGFSSASGLYGPCSVLVVDQLSEDYPNPGLIEHIVGVFHRLNCTVTVIPGPRFTLEDFRLFQLYDVIIFRGHTGWANIYNPQTGQLRVLVGFFTGQKYRSDLYVDLQRRGLVVEGIPFSRPVEEPNKTYIAVTQEYIREYVPIKRGSTFILATCFAGSKQLAGVLLEKGASTVIGWDKNVTVTRADQTLEELVDYYAKYHSWTRAARELPSEYRYDPQTGARLIVYTSKG